MLLKALKDFAEPSRVGPRLFRMAKGDRFIVYPKADIDNLLDKKLAEPVLPLTSATPGMAAVVPPPSPSARTETASGGKRSRKRVRRRRSD